EPPEDAVAGRSNVSLGVPRRSKPAPVADRAAPPRSNVPARTAPDSSRPDSGAAGSKVNSGPAAGARSARRAVTATSTAGEAAGEAAAIRAPEPAGAGRGGVLRAGEHLGAAEPLGETLQPGHRGERGGPHAAARVHAAHGGPAG